MKATVELKNDCILVKTKKQTELLEVVDMAVMHEECDSLNDFVDEVYEYFESIIEGEISRKDIQQVCKKVYPLLQVNDD